MKKKLSLNKLTLGHLTDIEQRGIVGGSGELGTSNLYIQTVCAQPVHASSSYLATCPAVPVTPASCRTLPFKSCSKS